MTATKEENGRKVAVPPGASEKKRLYRVYGKPLEEAHKGEYVAIGRDGQTILGSRAGEVLEKAIKTFGDRNFTIARVGYRTFGTWLSSR